MDKTRTVLTTEQKLELIRGRAVKFGLRSHDLEDAVQEVALHLLEFTPDPARSNGASESTILTAVIDRRLKQWLRTRQRYQDMIERHGELLPDSESLACDDGTCRSDTMLDVREVVASLPQFEQQVCQLLGEGLSATAVARELGCGRRAVSRAVEAIRERLAEAGLGGEESA